MAQKGLEVLRLDSTNRESSLVKTEARLLIFIYFSQACVQGFGKEGRTPFLFLTNVMLSGDLWPKWPLFPFFLFYHYLCAHKDQCRRKIPQIER